MKIIIDGVEVSVETIARAWASMDGHEKDFDECKENPAQDETDGYYIGYLTDTEELMKRSVKFT